MGRVARRVEADFVDTIGLVGWDGEAGSHGGGGEEGGEVDEVHVGDLGAGLCGVQE